ncbi:hypothetical protein [Yersinia enterocolitica]|uniref:hypothetical protein n=1 Tax=Yersinia enterocolitica TaxID=630 RepID=UPI003F488EA1
MSKSQKAITEAENETAKEDKKDSQKSSQDTAPELIKMKRGDLLADVHPDMVQAWKEEGWHLA